MGGEIAQVITLYFSRAAWLDTNNTNCWYKILPNWKGAAWCRAIRRNTSISLGDHLTQFVDSQVASGRYGSVSDVVRAGLRLLEIQETELRALQEALRAGESSGTPAAFDGQAFLARLRAKHGS